MPRLRGENVTLPSATLTPSLKGRLDCLTAIHNTPLGGIFMSKDIINYQHNGTSICVRDYWNKTQLLFDGAVIDTRKGFISFGGYTLCGTIGTDLVTARSTLSFVGEVISLAINDQVVATAWKA